MKPISVRFKCFGPYLQEQVIDFRELEENGLFLICGETGSGKTTILDAMCIALFGEASGASRGDLTAMRCKRADPTEETLVEYIFSIGENTYRFYRSIKPRKKRKSTADPEKRKDPSMNETCECQILKDGVFIPVPDAKDKKTFLNQKAVELIGLTCDQFRQVIILPQGQFEKLLVSKSEDKEEILVKLFHADRWQKIAQNLYKKADVERKRLDGEKLRIQEHFKQYSCENPEQLEAKIRDSEENLSHLQEECRLAEQAASEAEQKLMQVRKTEELFQKLDECTERLRILRQKEDSYRQEETSLSLADRAETIAPIYREYAQARSEHQKMTKKVAVAAEKLEQVRAEQQNVKLACQAHESDRSAYEDRKRRLVLLETAAEIYQNLSARKTQADQDRSRMQQLKKTEMQTAERCSAAQQAWEHAKNDRTQKLERYQQGQQLYLEGIGSVLAQRLKEGEKCPVCGSIHHPEPAKPVEGHMTEEALDALTADLEQASRRENEAWKVCQQAEKEELHAHNALAEAEQTAALSQSALDQALKQRLAGIDTEQQRKKAVSACSQEVTAYEARGEKLQRQQTEADSACGSAEQTLQLQKQELEAAETCWAAAQQQWKTALEESGFATEQAYLAAELPAQEKQQRRDALIRYRADVEHSQSERTKQEQMLDGQIRPDRKEAEKALNMARKAHLAVSGQADIQKKVQQDMKSAAEQLNRRMQTYQAQRLANEEQLLFATRLRGDHGISLQRYVLGVMLTSITRAANQLLKTVYGGRYQLYRTDAASGSTQKRGLELEVADRDGRRSVTTLSGGEKFLLSLSLAIGLSTVVQAQGDGVRLEAMFIDEGFGSLDRKSIDDAMEMLQTVRRSAGIVGIISHVDRLAELIPAKIQITKTKDGSVSKVCC